MPPIQPSLDPRAMKRQLREINPEYQGTDDDLYQMWIAQNPAYRSAALGKEVTAGQTLEDPSWFTQALTTTARIAPAVAGSIIGGTAGSIVPGAGTVAGIAGGGLIGSVAGETLAQGIEQFLGQREGFNPMSIGISGALGAVPGAGKIPALTKMAPAAARALLRQRAGREALKGGALGATGDVGFQLSETGEINPMQTFLAGGMGAVAGGGLTSLSQRGALRPEPTVKVPKLSALEQEQADIIKQSLDNPNASLNGLLQRLRTLYVDREASLKTFIQQETENAGVRLKYDDANPTVASDLAGGAARQVEESLNQIEDLAHRVWQRGMAADVDQLLTLKGFRRAAEDWEGKIQRAMAKGKQEEVDALVAKMAKGEILPQGYKPGQIKADYAKIQQSMDPARFEEVNLFAEELIQYNRASLDMMMDASLINAKTYRDLQAVPKGLTQQQIKNLKQQGLFGQFKDREGGLREHIPLLRFLDAMGDTPHESIIKHAGKDGGRWKLSPFKGSQRATVQPMDASFRARKGIQLAAAENKRKLAILNFRDLNDDFKALFPRVRNLKNLKDGHDVFTVIVNGKKRVYSAPAPVAAAINHLDEAGVAMLGEAGLNFFARLTARFATSLNVGFSVTNVLRDNADLLMMRKIVHNPIQLGGYVVEWGKTLAQILGQEAMYGARNVARAVPFGLGRKLGKLPIPAIKGQQEFVQSGAGFSGMTRSLAPGQFIGGSVMEEGGGRIGNMLIGGIDTVLSPFARFSGALEDTTKLAAFKTLRKQGIDPTEAAWLTRKFGGSPDFAVRGRYARGAGSMVLFFNAQMQGIVRNASNLKDLAKDPKAFGGMMMAVTGLELARMQWNDRFTDPDGTRSADRMTNSDRENYWTFVLPETEVVNGVERHKMAKMSKGHLARILFNPVADMLQASASERETFSPTQTTLNLFEQFSPGSINLKPGQLGESFRDGVVSSMTPLIKTPIELAWNRRTFSGVPLESLGVQGRSPGRRTTDRTSPALKRGFEMLEDAGFEAPISPIKTEHILRSVLPGPGEQALAFADALVEGKGPGEAAGTALVDPLLRRFTGSEGDQVFRDLSNKFYREIKRTSQAQADLRNIQVNEPSKAQAFVNKNMRLLQYRLPLQRVKSVLDRLRKLPPDQGAPMIRQYLDYASTLIDQMNDAKSKR